MGILSDDTEAIENAIIMLMFVFTGVFLPAISLFFFGGIEYNEFFNKVSFYYSFGAVPFAALVSLGMLQILVKGGVLSFDMVGWARNLFHDPEISLIRQIAGPGVEKVLTLSNIFNFSIIIFSILGIVTTIANSFFVAAPSATEFQVTETGDLLLSAEPAATSETLTFAIVLALGYGLGYWAYETKRIGIFGYVLSIVATITVNVIGWIVLHTARYSNNEIAIVSVAVFAFLGAFFTILTGSIIPWYIAHFMNNLFLRAKQILNSDSVILAVVIFIILYILLIVYFKFIKK